VQVKDTRIALGEWAAFHRQQFQIPVIGLTGSCGKTTTKSMIAQILQQCGSTLATEGTLNNDIGVPKTLLGLNAEHQYAVIEMGANHHGEIAYVTAIAKPTVAFINNVAPAHLAGFGDLPGVARAKAEIFQALPKDGVVILNADDAFADYWRDLPTVKGHHTLTFGRKQPADVTARNLSFDAEGYPQFELVTPQGNTAIHLKILGEHNVMNALAATAAALAVGAPLTAIKAGLENAAPVYQRLVVHQGYQGATIIDDSYNANPLSMKAAIHILAQKKGEKILAVGEMRELGENAAQYHAEIGEEARRYKIDRLYAYGDLTAETVKAFGDQGYHFTDQASLIAALRPQLNSKVTVLVKGSLSTKMKNVVAALL
jgi:UDP-N-acetylmuramoyl-tripeptide--D-alanyl-D-alanine ligase